MTIEEALAFCKKNLSTIESKILLSFITNIDSNNLINHFNDRLKEEQIEKLNECINERINKKRPIQYIINSVNFYGLDLYVNENVLIPRFETEELVETTINYLNKNFTKPKVLDLCCGSGAIGIAIKNRIKDSDVTISDISKKALEVAKYNIEKHNLDIKVIESDLFNNITDKYDCIISNPPYIRDDEEIEDIVKENEPHLALYGGKEGLDFYERILKNINEHINDKYLIAFEIGMDQKEKVINLANKYMSNIRIEAKKDLSNNDRIIMIYNK